MNKLLMVCSLIIMLGCKAPPEINVEPPVTTKPAAKPWKIASWKAWYQDEIFHVRADQAGFILRWDGSFEMSYMREDGERGGSSVAVMTVVEREDGIPAFSQEYKGWAGSPFDEVWIDFPEKGSKALHLKVDER